MHRDKQKDKDTKRRQRQKEMSLFISQYPTIHSTAVEKGSQLLNYRFEARIEGNSNKIIHQCDFKNSCEICCSSAYNSIIIIVSRHYILTHKSDQSMHINQSHTNRHVTARHSHK